MFICITIINIIFKDYANYKIDFINDQKTILMIKHGTKQNQIYISRFINTLRNQLEFDKLNQTNK